MNSTRQWFQTCGMRTPRGTRRTGWGYKNNIGNGGKQKKGVKIQSYEVFWFTKRDLCESCH
jgi:hypothetical protein